MKPFLAVALSASLLAPVAIGAAPTQSYAQIKSAIVALRSQDAKRPVARDGAYDIESCEFGSDFIGDGNDLDKITRAGIYADIANYVSVWESELPRVGYPRSAWHAWTSNYESKAIATANAVAPRSFYEVWRTRAPALDGLKNVLVAYRKTHRRAAAIQNVGGCGAGEAPITVVTQPAATQVSIIPAFFYELCRVQRIDPNDTMRCAHWREISGTVTQISGDYHYIAKWHDGTVKRGLLGINSQPAMMTNTITLRKP